MGRHRAYLSLLPRVRDFVLILISEMVSLIPRLSSFAVSGTPAKTRVSDLSYVLKLVGQPFPILVLT